MQGISRSISLTGLACIACIAVAVAVQTPVDSIGFSGTSMMIPYHIGVVDELVKAGVWVPGETRVAGSSGGSYIAASVTSGTTAEQLRKGVESLMARILAYEAKCVEEGGSVAECSVANGKFGIFTTEYLESIIPHDPKKYKRTNDKSYTHITVITEPLPQPEPLPTDVCSKLSIGNLTVGRYSDRNDLVAALKASSFYSLVTSTNCTTSFRNKRVTDGGYTVHLPCPPRSKSCLRVEALINDQAELKKCEEAGNLVPGGSADADIYPGLGTNNVLPLDPCSWQLASVNATLQSSNLQQILQQGATDARFWLKQNGWI